MNTSNFFRYLVPYGWSADQALLAVELLGQVSDAIWAVHGEAMTDALADDPDRAEKLGCFLMNEDDDEEILEDEDLPF